MLWVLLFGCSVQGESVTDGDVSGTSQVVSESLTTNDTATEKAENDNQAQAVTSTSGQATAQRQTTSGASTTTTTTKKAPQQTTRASTTARQTTASKSTTTTTKPTQRAKITCTVTIECSVVLENMDKLRDGHEVYVTNGGVMLERYTVTAESGATAYDIVSQACRENSISMNVTKSGYGTYIAGFNNIDEKDCGGGSGWIYYVNGSMPNKSCGKYTVSDGDFIKFSYVC